MLRKLSLSLVVLLALSGATVASAATPRQVKTLKHRVSELTKANAQLRKANAELEIRASDFAVKLGQTQVLLGSANQNLSDMTADRDYWKTPTELQTAVEQVRQEVEYTRRIGQAYNRPVPDGYLISLAAMNYVVGHVTAPAYGYRYMHSFALPGSAETALEMQAGICGDAAWTFGAIVKAFGLPVRSASFYFPNGVDTHIADETFYAGAWHYFDPTWGLTFTSGTDTLSLTAARSGTPFELRHDQNLLWYLMSPELASQFPLMTDPATRVVLGLTNF
jgi:hypothetical protein